MMKNNLDQGVEKARPLEEEEIIELTDEVIEAAEEGAGDNTVEEVSLSPEHLEEALERVVEKMFSEKIEKMLAEMIEAAVSREIKSIK